MNVNARITVIATCGMLLGLPAAHAQETSAANRLKIEIGLVDHDFSAYPANLTLKAGETYRLEFVNWSQGIRHVVMGPEFAGAVVTTGVQQLLPEPGVMPSASFGGGIEVPPSGGRVAVIFVPRKAGRYKLFCQDQVHTQAGMEVTVDIRL